MTSVVNTSVKHYHSAMVGAPALNGAAGSLIGLLDACLINGFDLKAVTSLVVAGGIATLSFSGSHSATVDSVVLVSGSSIAALNGEQKVTSISAGIVRFATAEANATATGTIDFKMAPAGYWVKEFAGTNLAVYRSTDPAGTGMRLRVNDTGTTTARVIGYEQMTDVNTGTGSFPTEAQRAGGGYWPKSAIANTVATTWCLFADPRMFTIFIGPQSSVAAESTHGFTHGFGDGIPFRPGGDPFMCFLSYSASATSVSNSDGALDGNGQNLQRAFPRAYTGLGESTLHALLPYTGNPALASGLDTFFGGFPSLVDGGLRITKRYFATAASQQPPRGDLPGLYFVAQNATSDSFKIHNVINGSGNLSGRRLFAVPTTGGSANAVPSITATGVSFIDVTGPWR